MHMVTVHNVADDNMCQWTTICAVRVGTYCRRRQYVQNDNMYRHRPSSPFNLYVGKHVAEIKASASQNSNGAPWLQPDSYEKWYRRDRPRSKSGLVSVYFRQSVIYLCKRSILHLYRSLESRYLKPKNEKLPLCLPDFYVRGYKNTLPPDS